MIGKTISHYEILEKLGEGGMGVVYKARDTKLDRTVALKFLPSHLGADETEKQRFLNEAKAASALDHSNICAIHSIEETGDGNLFIVMAHYEGMSLKERIEQGPLPLQDVVNYTIQISSGLQKAHEKGIVHRDLKPANIFITNDDQVKIIDFGLAKAAQRTMLTKSGATLGTVPYMSPEQAQGSTVDHRTDIWSLGVVMYEMITGQLPFKSEYETALAYSIINEDPEPVTALRSGVPMELERIINKCLEKNNDDRYQWTNEINIDVRKVEKLLSGNVNPKDFKKDSNVEAVDNGSSTLNTKKILAYIVPFLLLLFGLYFLFSNGSDVSEIDRSIAVLPLENLSPDPDDAFFTSGMHEDIIIQLSRIGNLQVIARSSVAGYAPGERDIPRISDELGVGTILEGSIRRIADRIRVAVTLTDARTNRTLWADTFDRNLIDVFEIQSEIAREIAGALETSLTPEEQKLLDDRPTDVTEAYEFYLRGREYFSRPDYSEENFRSAKVLSEQAIEYDPEFANAYALISRVRSRMHWFGYDISDQNLQLSRTYAERALEISSDLPEAHIAMGYYYYHGHRMYEDALTHLNIARRSQPSDSDIISAIAFIERRRGLYDNALQNLERARSLDPASLFLKLESAFTYQFIRDYERADVLFRRLLSLSPDLHAARMYGYLNTILRTGDVDSVRAAMQTDQQPRSAYPAFWVLLQFYTRDFEGMLKTVRELPDDIYEYHDYILPSSYILGLAHDYSGNKQTARDHYDQALVQLENMSTDYHDDWRYRVALGKVYAGLGLKEQALEEGYNGIELLSIPDDKFTGPLVKEELAIIYAQLRESRPAVEILREILSMPSKNSVERLKVDPFWDPIRDTQEFQNLLLEFSERLS